jgi:hypothetical protein
MFSSVNYGIEKVATIILGNLIASGQVRVEVVFAVECRARLNIRAQGYTGPHSEFDAFSIEPLEARLAKQVDYEDSRGNTYGQCSRESCIERRDVRVERSCMVTSHRV